MPSGPAPSPRSRRGNGTLRRRKDGTYEARLWYRGRGGVWERRSIYGSNPTDVGKRLRAALAQRDAGTLPAATGKLSLGAFLDDWLAGKTPTVRPRTMVSYTQLVRHHIAPALGAIAVNKLRPEHIAKLYAAMLEKKCSPKTVRNAAALLHSALEQALRYRVISVNPASLVDLPRHARAEMKTLNAEQARALIESSDAASDSLTALWALALGTGARQGELLGLMWSDLDARLGQIHIQRSLIYVKGGGDYLVEPKTRSSRRTIHLAPALVERLHASQGVGGSSPPRRPVIQPQRPHLPAADGRPLSQNIVTKAWRAALLRAELPAVRFHDARHSAATILLERGMSARMVADLLGHANVTTTLNLYAHSTPTQHQQAAAILGEFLS